MKTCNQRNVGGISVPLTTLYIIIFNWVLKECEQFKIFDELFMNLEIICRDKSNGNAG